MASDTTVQRGKCLSSPFKRFSLPRPRPISSDVVTSHRLDHMFKSISNFVDYKSSLCTICQLIPSSYKRQLALHTTLWRHLTAAFALKLSGFGGAFNQALHPSKSDDSLISLARELKSHSDRLRRIFLPHSCCGPEHDPPSISTVSDDLSIYSHMVKCQPTLVRAVFADSVEEVPLTHFPGSNGTFSKPQYTAQDALRDLLVRDPLARGQEYLRRNAGNLYSQTTQSIEPGDPLELLENFSQLLILETTNDP